MLTFKTSEETPTPKPQDIIIDGKKVGKVEPHLECDDSLRWHACINLGCSLFLVQGHGPTPASAVADGIIRARKEHVERAEKLAQLEDSLNVRDLEHPASVARAIAG